MRGFIRFFIVLVSNGAKSNYSGKIDFALSCLGNLFHYASTFILITVLSEFIFKYSGIGQEYLYLLFATTLISYGIFGCFFYHLNFFGNLIKGFELDHYFVKPRGALFLILFRNFNPVFLTHIAIGSIVYWIFSIPMELSLLSHVNMFLGVIGGVMIQLGITLFIVSLSFYLNDVNYLYVLLIQTPRNFLWFPVTLFPTIIFVIFTFFLPYTLIGYYPLSYSIFPNQPFWGGVSILVGIVMTVAGVATVQTQLKKYQKLYTGFFGGKRV